MKVSLRAMGTSNVFGRFVCCQYPVTIGRADNASIVLSDRWVSRNHCQLELVEDRVVLRDLGSKHGTFVNGKKVVESTLNLGDQIDVGLTSFVVEPEQVSADTASVEIAVSSLRSA